MRVDLCSGSGEFIIKGLFGIDQGMCLRAETSIAVMNFQKNSVGAYHGSGSPYECCLVVL